MKFTEKFLIFIQFFTIAASVNDFETRIIDANLNDIYTKVINSSVQFIFHYKQLEDSGLRIFTQSSEAFENHPLLVVVRQQRGVLSWQIPFYVKRDDTRGYAKYLSVNRTLCPIENNPAKLEQETM